MGEVIQALFKEGHLTPRQCAAGVAFLTDLQWGGGSSSGMVLDLDRTKGSGRQPLYPPGGYESERHLRCREVLTRLRGHERDMLKFLVTHREKARGTLADWGRQRSAYTTAKTARARAVGEVAALLESIAELYPSPSG